MSERYIKINGIKHWVKLGIKNPEDTPLVILHGGPGGFTYVYEKVPGQVLEKHQSVIYYEQRGCGRSEEPVDEKYSIEYLVDDLKKLITQLGYSKVHLLGYSFGGELAAEFTLVYPEMVEKLILHTPSDMSDFKRIYRIQYEGIKSVLPSEKLPDLESIHLSQIDLVEKYNKVWSLMDQTSSDKLLFHNQEHAKWNREQWRQSGLVNTGKMANQVLGRSREKTVCESAKQIMAKTLVIAGRHDKNVGVEIPMLYSQNIRNSSLIVLENSGHFPDIEESDLYVKEVVSFLSCNNVDRRNVQVYLLDKSSQKLLMLKRTAEKSGYWQPVCGGIENNESEVDAAIREVKEETGFDIVSEVKKLPFKFNYSEPKNDVPMQMEDTCYLVELDAMFDVKFSHEHVTYEWCDLQTARELTDWKPIKEVCLYLKTL